MKELSIKQKAQRYDESLKAAVVAHKDEDKHLKATLERIFPELKESEDERIRKGLLYVIEHHPTLPTKEAEEYIAWLEKQGEQKPFDYENANIQQKDFAPKIEPKFKVGDKELNKDGKEFYYKTIGLLEQYTNSDNEVEKQNASSCINWLKSVIKHEKIIKYKIGDRVRFFPHHEVFIISDIDEVNERYISTTGDHISFYEELIPVKSSINRGDIKCGDYLTTEDGTVIKVHNVDENERVHYFYYAKEMTEDGGDISNNFGYYCAILSDCRKATQEEINFLEKWVAHKKYVWVENNVSPDDEEDD